MKKILIILFTILELSLISYSQVKPKTMLIFSNYCFNDLYSLNHNILGVNNALNRILFADYDKLSRISLFQTSYHLYLNIGFHRVMSEKILLNRYNINASIFPIPINKYYSTYIKNIKKEDINKLKSKNNVDYNRLLIVRDESNYSAIKIIEEEMFKSDLFGKKFSEFYFKYYYIENFLRRMTIIASYAKANSDIFRQTKKKINNIATFNNRYMYFVQGLFSTDSIYSPNISKINLTESEKKYLKRIPLFGLINLMSPFILGKRGNEIRKDTYIAVSLGYNLVPFGEQYEQNIWFKNKYLKSRITVKEFACKENKLGLGISLSIFDYAISDRMFANSEMEYWYQPENLMFTDKKFINGLAWRQYISIPLKSNKKIQYDFIAGFSFKTKGYVVGDTETNEAINLFLGVNIK